MAVEVTVSGNKKIETLMKQFNEKFPYLQLGIFPMSAKDDKTKTPVDKSLTIAKVRTKVAPGEISINGRKLVKNLEREFDDIFGIYVEVCYCGKDGIDYYTAGAYDDLSLTALNNEIESLGGVKDKWCADELHAAGDVAPTPKAAPVEEKAEVKPAKEEKETSKPTIDLDALINAALADGVVTDKERAILIKKVTEAGMDVDEFELLLDGKIVEAQKKAEAEKNKAKAEAAQADAERLAAEKAKANAEKMKAEMEAAQAELAKSKAEAEKAKAAAEKAKAEAAKVQQSSSELVDTGAPKKKDPFFADMVKVEGTFSDFYISKYQVTQAQWFAVMGNNPSKFQANNNPVESVSWNDCQEFIKKLNQLTGKKYRLPTSGEWQFAASGGSQTKNYKYAGSNTLDEVAWYDGNCGNTTHPVGQKKPNELGLYDMTGNVWEWCEDWYSVNFTRVNRGGSWVSNAGSCEVSRRSGGTPYSRDVYVGFRLAL